MQSNKKIEKLISQIEDAKIYFEELQEKKQNSYDNKSERWQESEKADELQTEIDSLQELSEECESLMDNIQNLFEGE